MTAHGPHGGFHVADGVEWYRIDDVDHLEPFLVSVISPYDHWMFVSSSGALTAGRGNAQRALFPYETDDRLHRAGGRSGPVTLVRVHGRSEVWQPFAPHAAFGDATRSLAKSVAGDRLRFEEHDRRLGLTFRSTWATSLQHGLVRICELALDANAKPTTFDLLDGLLEIMPAGVELSMQQTTSTLVDAYRRNELDAPSGLAIFSLEAAVSDLPLAAESLTANTVWSRGLDGVTVALSDRQLRAFRSGEPLRPEPLVTGTKAAFLQSTTVTLAPGDRLSWVVVGDVDRDHVEVAATRRWLLEAADATAEVMAAVNEATTELVELAADQDALQRSANRAADVHHFANVVYNAMRGGALLDDHRVDIEDVEQSIAVRNAPARTRFAAHVDGLTGSVPITELRRRVADDPELLRLVNEYLPLTFSRRHGDPSRPWNDFEIPARPADGARVTGYEGNWRDIFQNWEALLHSFPDYLESAVSKFLSASTRDGHNPYRINHQGVDWEVPEEDDSWGNFGYWGDHQIVYLHRLLDALHRFRPGLLEGALDRRAFSYADVPYRIRPYLQLVKDPKHTLDFDREYQDEIRRREALLGTDGRLVAGADGTVHHASLAEKLLVPALAKLANLVPGGGIWMNTQRPEWNDANNALVGNGVSVVTAFYLRDYLAFVIDLLDATTVDLVPVDPAVLTWLHATRSAFDDHAALLDPAAIDAVSRRSLLDALGVAYDAYRASVYRQAPQEPVAVPVADLASALRPPLQHVDVITSTAGRDDGLVDSYRLLALGDDTAELRPLYTMLEGQVAALDSATIEAGGVLTIVEALFASDLHREDQGTFLLYPDRRTPSFLDRNRVPDTLLTPDVEALIDTEPDVLRRDVDGVVRFAPLIHNAGDLQAAFDACIGSSAVDGPVRSAVADLFEAVFDHQSFTGRSQSMYRYEGLGSIYWHMVAKLLSAVQRRLHDALASGADDATVQGLRAAYQRIRDGLGYRKTVAQQGAFPLDPHSHTPAHAGAQQPGMTGAVKEGVLLRLGELGVEITDGRVRFAPRLLDGSDFLTEPVAWPPLGPDRRLGPGTLGFTYCGVPIVYHRGEGDPWTRVAGPDLDRFEQGDSLDPETSRLLLSRSGTISRIDVGVSAPTERQQP